MPQNNGRILEFMTKIAPLNIFPGEWESIAPGEGFDFYGIRPFVDGDDLRRIHMPSLMVEGEERVVEKTAEVQVNIYMYADFSASMARNPEMHFFSKAEIRDALLALISQSAAKVYSPLSLCAFSDKVRDSFPAVMGDVNAQRIMRWALSFEGYREPASIKKAIEHAVNFAKRRSIVFVISDFLGERDFGKELKKASEMLDFIPVVVRSEQEKRIIDMNASARFVFKDARTGAISEIISDQKQRNSMRDAWERHKEGLSRLFNDAGLDWIVADYPDICFQELRKLFAVRAARKR